MTMKKYLFALAMMSSLIVADLQAVMPLLFGGAASIPPVVPILVAHTAASSSNGTSVLTSAIDTTGATFLVASMANQGGSIPTFADSKGNTWTTVHTYGDGTDVDCIMYFCYSPTVGSGHTFLLTNASGGFPSIVVMGFSNITTSAVNAESGHTTVSGSTGQPGSITPSVAHTLVITGVAFNDNTSGAVSVNSGYTIVDTRPFTAGNAFGTSAAYKVLSSASAQNPTWNITTATGNSTGIAALAY